MHLTWRYKLLPTRTQRRALEHCVALTRHLYNAGVEQRIHAWQGQRKSLTLFDQQKDIPALRADPELGYALFPSVFCRWPLKKVEGAFKGFFSRAKKRQGRAGFPRFRSASRFDTFGLTEWVGARLENGRFCLNGLGGSKKGSGIRYHEHRPLPEGAEIRAAEVTREGDEWFLCLKLRVPAAETTPYREEDVRGWDWGLEHAMTSDQGTTLERVRVMERHARKVRKHQRRVCHAPKGSKARKRAVRDLSRAKRGEADARRTRSHQVAMRVVSESPWVAVEKLAVRNMTASASGTLEEPGRNVAQKSGLNRAILDGSPSRLRQYIAYKAERAGGGCVEVRPEGTSQVCSGCLVTVRKALRERWHECPSCGLSLHRDVNAARNIRRLGIEVFAQAHAALGAAGAEALGA